MDQASVRYLIMLQLLYTTLALFFSFMKIASKYIIERRLFGNEKHLMLAAIKQKIEKDQAFKLIK